MTTTVNLKKTLHRKIWELLNSSQLGNTNNGFSVVNDNTRMVSGGNTRAYAISGTSSFFNYSSDEDSWMQQPHTGAAGTYNTGSCSEFRSIGVIGGTIDQTAAGGTTSIIDTTKAVSRSLVGCKIRVISGAGAGYEGEVLSNTVGINISITVSPTHTVSFDSTTVFRIWSGSVWFFNAGTTSVGFSVFDIATNVWASKSVTNLPTAWGTSGQLLSTSSVECVAGTGTSTGSNTSTTLVNTTKSWSSNAYTNYQVRITTGTGAGQIRTISSNTATTLTVSAAWTVTPDSTSGYVIESNDDYMYLLGNNSVAMYRYSVSANTWTLISPLVVRTLPLATGGSADWISSVPNWTDETHKTLLTTVGMLKQNGRYIYSFRGGASSALDVYDISSNVWLNGIAYGGAFETFNTGSCSTYDNGLIYIQKEGTGRIYVYDVDLHSIRPFSHHPYQQGTTISGDLMFVSTYVDGATKIRYLYTFLHTSNILLRTLII